jgi:glycosyltransferase involved in cell wall biosynthesis
VNEVMEKISVAIITKNEEANIRGCLESVRWADDIVVVDSGSTDQTLRICGEFPVRVFGEDWKGFARQKNSAIAKTRHEWILSLDADERVTEKLKEEIARTLDSGPLPNGYFLARRNYFLGKWIKHCGWYPDHNLRLFRKGRGFFEEREVHEKATVQGRVGYLQEPLEHHTYRTVSDFLLRLDRYSSLAAREMRREGRRFRYSDWLFRPPFTFLQMYVLRAGFLEGYFGFLLSALYSYYTFAKYSKLREIQGLEDLRSAK